jgi:hypothetical protein
MAYENADRSRVLDRVTEILNLCVPGGYTSTLSPRNKTRNEDAIADFVDEAGLMILKAMAERPNEFRYLLLTDTSAITTSGNAVPLVNDQPHLGPPAAVKITLSSGGTVREGRRLDREKIQSYRELPQIYDPNGKAHNAVGSTLGGYYDLWDDIFYFTGYSAVLSLARMPVRAETATLIPGILENPWIRLAVGEAAKVGTGGYEQNIIGEYGTRGQNDLAEFKAGGRVFKEVDEPKPTSAVHNLTK